VAVEDITRGARSISTLRAAEETIAQCPKVADFAAFYFDAFVELRTERSIGPGGFGPVPVTRILDYARHYALSPPEEQTLKSVVLQLDGHDRERTAARVTKASK